MCRFGMRAKFNAVLRPRLLPRLPLHVAGYVPSTLGEGDNVIDHIAGPPVRESSLSLELLFGGAASLDLSVLVTLDARIGLRMRRLLCEEALEGCEEGKR